MAEIDARPLIDKQGNQYFPYTDVKCVNGLPDNLEELNSDDVIADIANIKLQLANLPNIPSITDTGWQNITLNTGITAYSTSWTPQYRFITMNGVSFLSLKGAVKGLTGAATIGTLPSNVVNKITDIRPFVQSMSNTNGTPNFNRWSIQPNGNINLEYSTTTITNTQWISFDITIML